MNNWNKRLNLIISSPVYVSLMTGTLLNVGTRAVARATFTLLENNLYFTINHKR